tara:strand:- start:302 stop:457 length:156 start_codon:yes stop_codon:yes gene_type:complete
MLHKVGPGAAVFREAHDPPMLSCDSPLAARFDKVQRARLGRRVRAKKSADP